LPPLNTTLARRLIEQTRVSVALRGVRGRRPVDLAALERLLVRFSQLILEQPWIAEIDINPLLASDEQLLALDARVVLHPGDIGAAKLPRPVIRPYPSQYETVVTLTSGETITIRPIRPEDEPHLVQFHQTLSDSTVYARYSQYLSFDQRSAHERLSRVCFVDYDREIALVAELHADHAEDRRIVGVARLIRLYIPTHAELAVVISDPYQRKGLGTHLITQLVEVARQEHIERLIAYLHVDNRGMKRLCEQLQFSLVEDQRTIVAKLEIRPAQSVAVATSSGIPTL
jgi:acetyltransferase